MDATRRPGRSYRGWVSSTGLYVTTTATLFLQWRRPYDLGGRMFTCTMCFSDRFLVAHGGAGEENEGEGEGTGDGTNDNAPRQTTPSRSKKSWALSRWFTFLTLSASSYAPPAPTGGRSGGRKAGRISPSSASRWTCPEKRSGGRSAYTKPTNPRGDDREGRNGWKE